MAAIFYSFKVSYNYYGCHYFYQLCYVQRINFLKFLDLILVTRADMKRSKTHDFIFTKVAWIQSKDRPGHHIERRLDGPCASLAKL